jgi:single-strand DNA-binding protein
MASVNRCFFIGNLTREPEVRYLPNGDAVANFSIAVNETWKDKSGAKQEKAEFINIVAYRKLAEIIGEYCKKGQSIFIAGKFQTRKWEKDGVTRYATEIIADEMQMLGAKDGATSSAQRQDSRPDEQEEQPEIPF